MSHVISTKSSVKVDVDAKPTATIIRAPNGWPGRARFGLVPVGQIEHFGLSFRFLGKFGHNKLKAEF